MSATMRAKALSAKAQAEFKAGNYGAAAAYLERANGALIRGGLWNSSTDIAARIVALILLMNEQKPAPASRPSPAECPHCEYDRRFPGFEAGGWIQQENNGPIVSCPMCNDDGAYLRDGSGQ